MFPNHSKGTNVRAHEPVWNISQTNHSTYKFTLQLNTKRLYAPRYVNIALCTSKVATGSWGCYKALEYIAVEKNIKKLTDNDNVRYIGLSELGEYRTAEWGRLDPSACCILVTSSGILTFQSNISEQFYQ